MSPTAIEAELRAASPLLAHACVIGDARLYNVALLALDPEAAALLPGPEAVRAEVERAVGVANRRLARVQQVKRFSVVAAPWEIGQELTPTMKVRREAIAARHQAAIDAMYGGATPRGPDLTGRGTAPPAPTA